MSSDDEDLRRNKELWAERRAELQAEKDAVGQRERQENSYQAAVKNEAHAFNTDLSQHRMPQLSEAELNQARQEWGARSGEQQREMDNILKEVQQEQQKKEQKLEH